MSSPVSISATFLTGHGYFKSYLNRMARPVHRIPVQKAQFTHFHRLFFDRNYQAFVLLLKRRHERLRGLT
ncbi:hypothetical protein J6590_032363 [Homalodisca vitripennis]|nr:hypothetical protein J6590_032363 [Homalodisca vitripennis]